MLKGNLINPRRDLLYFYSYQTYGRKLPSRGRDHLSALYRFQEFISDPTKVSLAVGGLTALSLGFFTAMRGSALVSNYVNARLGVPSLLQEASRVTLSRWFNHPIKSAKLFMRRHEDPLTGVVLEVRSCWLLAIRWLVAVRHFAAKKKTRIPESAALNS